MAKGKKAQRRRQRKPAQVNARVLEARHARRAEQLRVSTARAKTRFLREYAVCGIVFRAAQAAKVGRRTVYEWRQQDEAFKDLYDEAYQDAIDAMEEEARRRGEDGVLEPVYQGGERVGTIRKYSDTLLITMLKARRPDVFRDRHEHTGKNGGPIESAVSVAVIDAARASLQDKLTQLAARATDNAAVARGGAPA